MGVIHEQEAADRRLREERAATDPLVLASRRRWQTRLEEVGLAWRVADDLRRISDGLRRTSDDLRRATACSDDLPPVAPGSVAGSTCGGDDGSHAGAPTPRTGEGAAMAASFERSSADRARSPAEVAADEADARMRAVGEHWREWRARVPDRPCNDRGDPDGMWK